MRVILLRNTLPYGSTGMTMILRAHSMTYVAYRLRFTYAEVFKSCFT